MAQALVTGGAGFIGSHVVDALLAEGHSVTIVDNFSLGKREFVHPDARLIEADICDALAMQSAAEGMDVIFHLAAEPRLPLSIKEPLTTHDVNVTGTLNMLEAARIQGVQSFVFSSSAAIYGDQEQLPVAEDATPQPLSPYSAHKLIGETYVQLYHRLFGLSGVCLRYFNVYGRRKGVDGGYPACIPIFFKQRAAGEPLTIVGDGDQTRDYVHVTDVAAANLAAWQSDIHDGRAYNVGTQTEISVQDVANLIGGTHTYLPPRIEIKRSVAQTARAAQELGWTPSVSFDAGMNDLAEWWGVSLQQNQ